MKIVVQTIMKDEPAEFVERWADSALDADELILVDTGSTNGCDEVARDLGITVHQISVDPWRFDVARNTALALVPEDVNIVVKLDVDEILAPGWRSALESAPAADRYRYAYIWSHTPEGAPDVSFLADHTIARHNWIWRHPVHEALSWLGPGEPYVQTTEMTIVHLPDQNKSRRHYLPLLAQAVREDPNDDRMAHYYARELFFSGNWVAARSEFMRHLSLPSAKWPAERAQSYRYLAKMDDYPERWLLKAAAEAPDRREPWVDLADLAQREGKDVLAAGYAYKALEITDRANEYLSESHAWDDDHLRSMLSAVAPARPTPSRGVLAHDVPELAHEGGA